MCGSFVTFEGTPCSRLVGRTQRTPTRVTRGQHLLEQFQPFAAQLAREPGNTGNVAARMRQAINEPGRDRVLICFMTIGIVLVACLADRIADGSTTTMTSTFRHKFRNEVWGSFEIPFGMAILNLDILALNVTEVPSALVERHLPHGLHGAPKLVTYPIRGVFAGCCASANEQSAKSRAQSKPDDFSGHIFSSIHPLRHSPLLT